jgi:integrase
MRREQDLPVSIYQVDRPLHHELAMAAYRDSFRHRTLSERYQNTEFRLLNEVFTLVSVGDPAYPTIRRPIDTFDLTNPYQAARIRDAVYRDIQSKPRKRPSRHDNPRAVSCLKAIDRYCLFLKKNPTIYLEGHQAIYLPDIYGAIESPVNLYSIPRPKVDRMPNRNFLEKSEYHCWLQFAFSQIRPDLTEKQLRKAMQFYLMCVIAGETGMRIQEILGLQPEHFSLGDDTCLVVKGKGSNGSGYRKRPVPISPMVKATLSDFLKQFPRAKGEPLFQNHHGQRLSMNTAAHWMKEMLTKIEKAELPIQTDVGFGWHAFRRTSTRLFLEQSSDIRELMRQKGWAWASTVSHYIGDEKQKLPPQGPPLLGKPYGGAGHGG